MAQQRIRGQEVKLMVLQDAATIASLTDIRNFSVTPKFTKLEEGYLGETTKRYDEIFEGVDFDMELHVEDPQIFAFISSIIQRAADRTSKIMINIMATLQFANGAAPTVILSNCFFENMPINVGGRSEYVTYKLSGSCSTINSI